MYALFTASDGSVQIVESLDYVNAKPYEPVVEKVKTVSTVSFRQLCVYISDNTSLPTTTITGALFDREAQTNARFQLGEVTLSNGDKFYGPREQVSTSSFGSPGRFIDGQMSAFDMRPTNSASALSTENSYMSIWEFYYVPQLPTHVNECIIYVNASTGNLTHWVHSIDVVNGNTLVPVTNTNNELPLMFSEHNVAATQINYAVVDGGLKITFDAVTISKDTPIKLTLAQNNDSMYIADIQFGFEGPVPIVSVAPASTLSLFRPVSTLKPVRDAFTGDLKITGTLFSAYHGINKVYTPLVFKLDESQPLTKITDRYVKDFVVNKAVSSQTVSIAKRAVSEQTFDLVSAINAKGDFIPLSESDTYLMRLVVVEATGEMVVLPVGNPEGTTLYEPSLISTEIVGAQMLPLTQDLSTPISFEARLFPILRIHHILRDGHPRRHSVRVASA